MRESWAHYTSCDVISHHICWHKVRFGVVLDSHAYLSYHHFNDITVQELKDLQIIHDEILQQFEKFSRKFKKKRVISLLQFLIPPPIRWGFCLTGDIYWHISLRRILQYLLATTVLDIELQWPSAANTIGPSSSEGWALSFGCQLTLLFLYFKF